MLVLHRISQFWCSHFILHAKVIKSIESKCYSFIWSGNFERSKKAKVSWHIVCLPKKERGLILNNISAWNKTCIARLVWLIFCGTESLWLAWVNKHLLKDECFWELMIKPRISWTWRKLLRLRDVFKPFLQCKVGNGQKFFVWHDH